MKEIYEMTIHTLLNEFLCKKKEDNSKLMQDLNDLGLRRSFHCIIFDLIDSNILQRCFEIKEIA